MKQKQLIYILILIFVTLAGMWAIPELVKTATYSKNRYPFVYYSSLKKDLFFKEFDDRKNPLHDAAGNFYTEQAFDSLMPLLNFRQLTINGAMPDSIDGKAIEPRNLKMKQVTFKYAPTDINTPEIGLYIMYESLSKKGKLESPGDVFRITDKIEFIDIKTNTADNKKSELFQSALQKADFSFPAQWASGNMNIKKPYDEGYFILDAKGELFHVKMVNGKPFVRNTKVGNQIQIAAFSMLEVADKRFYGFLFDKKGSTYIIEESAGKYHLVQLEIDPIDINQDELVIMGNLLYWTVSVQTKSGKHFYALETESLKKVDYDFREAPANKWDEVAQWIFPCYLTFKAGNSDYIHPQFHFTGYQAFLCNFILALVLVLVLKRPRKKKIVDFVFVALFGIAGGIAILIIPTVDNN